jgi:alpha-glucuronidase
MHHVPYTYVLHSGKTVAQHIYDSHYEGAAAVEGLIGDWRSLHGKIDEERYQSVLARLEFQRGHAILWRDVMTEWLQDKSGIADAKGRVYRHANRIEAESMQLDGYTVAVPEYPYAASGRKYIACTAAAGHCAASFTYQGAAGNYSIAVVYYDLNNGASHYRLLIDGKAVDEWKADLLLPTAVPDTHTAVRRESPAIALHPGSTIRLEATVNGGEMAPVDYVELLPLK